MKRRMTLILLALVVAAASLAGCQREADQAGNDDGTVQTEDTEDTTGQDAGKENADKAATGETPAESADPSGILVAYFSWADNAILEDDVDAVTSPSVIPPGNVQQLAGWVQDETGGDLFAIRVTDPYPNDWDECLDRAHQEREEDARPELVENVDNLDQYDVIFLGYPNWWYGVPMPLLTFFENNDFSGKQVYLFCSHGTGGLANSVEIITEAADGADISDNIFDCYEEDASGSQGEIENWIRSIQY